VTPSKSSPSSSLTLSTCGANLLGSILSPGTAAANPQLRPIQSDQLDSGLPDIESISITAVPDFPVQTAKFFSLPVVLHHYINSGLTFGLIQCSQLNLALGAENGGPRTSWRPATSGFHHCGRPVTAHDSQSPLAFSTHSRARNKRQPLHRSRRHPTCNPSSGLQLHRADSRIDTNPSALFDFNSSIPPYSINSKHSSAGTNALSSAKHRTRS
jgi:hypothetical protein